ncbi:MAG: thioredoxin-disulfide reductase [Firmicutes bacterium]|nr:thioredoxin-disulfide reductase [Bacillota bacterium]
MNEPSCNIDQNSEIFDVMIVGGGPAGLTAGIYSSRAMLKTVLLEKALTGGQIASTGYIDNYPGFRRISGMELAQNMEEHAKDFGLEIQLCEVQCISKSEDGTFCINTSCGQYRGRTIILTTGVKPRSLGIPGEKELRGKGVSYCAICDGFFYKDKHVAVIGGGDSALEEGEYLTKFASKVTVIHRRDEFRAVKILQERAFENPKMEFVLDTVVEEIIGDDFATGMKLKNIKTGESTVMNVDGIFVYIGTLPNTFICQLHPATDDMGYITTDDKMNTSIPGIYAAGDVRSKLLRQISTAVGDGATAAVSAERFIEELKHKYK